MYALASADFAIAEAKSNREECFHKLVERFVINQLYANWIMGLNGFPLRLYFLFKKIAIDAETAYGLECSLVIKEKVPLVVQASQKIPLNRVKEMQHDRSGK